jgi:hypothetical protein
MRRNQQVHTVWFQSKTASREERVSKSNWIFAANEKALKSAFSLFPINFYPLTK